MNRSKVFAILIGASLAVTTVRSQDNVEAIIAQNVRPMLPENGRGGGVGLVLLRSES